MGKTVISLFLAALVILSSAGVRAEAPLLPEAERAAAALRLAAGPSSREVVRQGRLVWLGGLELPLPPGSDVAVSARRVILRTGEAFGLTGGDDLSLTSSRDLHGVRYLHYQQLHDGLPVLGAQVVASVWGGQLRHVASSLVPTSAGRWPSAALSRGDAARAVQRWSGRPAVTPSAGDRLWLPLGRGRLLPVWVVTQRSATPPHDWRYLVEATTGAVLWRWDQLLRAEGYVWEPNPVESDHVPARVELPGLPDEAEVLEGDLAQSFRCVESTGNCTWMGTDCRICGVSEHRAMADEEGDFLYEPDEPSFEDPFAEVQAYYHAWRINDFFQNTLGFERICGGSSRITVFVNQHYPGDEMSSANAFYGDSDGDGCGDLTLGQGLGIDFSYDGDVIYHEFTHGIVEAAGGLGCAPMGPCPDDLGVDYTALGLNEGYADYFAVSYTDDSLLGEYAGSAFSDEGGIRDADNDHICPFDLVGESHYDGEILSGTGWEIRQILGAELTDRMMLDTLEAIPADADYAVFAAALLQTAQVQADQGNLSEDELAEVQSILGPEGRRILDCERIIPLDQIPEGHGQEPMVLYTFPGMSLPGPLQWSLTTPRRVTRLQFEVLSEGAPPDRAIVHVRAGQPVGVTMNFNPATYQLDVEYDDDDSFDVSRDPLVLDPDQGLESETTYYFALEYRCDQGCRLHVEGSTEGVPNTPPTADAGEDQTVEVGDTVTLDGTGSVDPDGDELVFAWEQIDGPDVSLDGADEAQPSFEALEEGSYLFQLTVTDPEGEQDTDEVSVTVVSGGGDEDGDTPDGGIPGPFDVRGGACSVVAVGSGSPNPSLLLDLL